MNNPFRLEAPHQSPVCTHCRVREICISESMTPLELRDLDRSIKRIKTLQKGDYLFRQGDPVNSIFVVRFGVLKSYLTDSEGVEQIVGFNFPGELVGMDSLEERRHTTSTEVLQDSSVCVLSWHDFNELSEHCQHFHTQMLNIVSRELIHTHELIKVLSQKSVEQKLAYFLLMVSQKMCVQGYSKNEFNLSMARGDIANFLGIAAAETISRELSELQQRKIIEVNRRHIRIKSMDALKSIAKYSGIRHA